MHVICNNENKAAKLSDDMDQVLGMPWQGKHFGGAPADVQTLHLASIRKHPTENKWAFPYDAHAKLHVTHKKDVEQPSGSTIEELTPDWTSETEPLKATGHIKVKQ
jgi:hypothetical protein